MIDFIRFAFLVRHALCQSVNFEYGPAVRPLRNSLLLRSVTACPYSLEASWIRLQSCLTQLFLARLGRQVVKVSLLFTCSFSRQVFLVVNVPKFAAAGVDLFEIFFTVLIYLRTKSVFIFPVVFCAVCLSCFRIGMRHLSTLQMKKGLTCKLVLSNVGGRVR